MTKMGSTMAIAKSRIAMKVNHMTCFKSLSGLVQTKAILRTMAKMMIPQTLKLNRKKSTVRGNWMTRITRE